MNFYKNHYLSQSYNDMVRSSGGHVWRGKMRVRASRLRGQERGASRKLEKVSKFSGEFSELPYSFHYANSVWEFFEWETRDARGEPPPPLQILLIYYFTLIFSWKRSSSVKCLIFWSTQKPAVVDIVKFPHLYKIDFETAPRRLLKNSLLDKSEKLESWGRLDLQRRMESWRV